MEKKFIVSIAALVLSILVAASILAFTPGSNSLVVNGTLIQPSGGTAFEIVEKLREKPAFIVSPQMNEPVQAVDHQIYNGTALFLQVLEGNRKQWLQVIRVYNEQGDLTKCVKGSLELDDAIELSPEDCLVFLSQENSVLVFVERPDPSLNQPILELSESEIRIRSKLDQDIGTVSFLALKLVFNNSQEILEKSNLILDGLRA